MAGDGRGVAPVVAPVAARSGEEPPPVRAPRPAPRPRTRSLHVQASHQFAPRPLLCSRALLLLLLRAHGVLSADLAGGQMIDQRSNNPCACGPRRRVLSLPRARGSRAIRSADKTPLINTFHVYIYINTIYIKIIYKIIIVQRRRHRPAPRPPSSAWFPRGAV